MSTPDEIVPTYMHRGGDVIFGMFHPAVRDSATRTAVLICPPFGWDDVCSYRSRREWGKHLAADGYPTLRIDLPGSGDSSGSPRDPARLSSWTDAVSEAAEQLRSMTGCGRVAAIGIGLGGLLVCRAVSEGAPLDELVLWGVPARGRRLLRELRAFARLEDSEAVVVSEDAPEPTVTPEGEIWVGGFVMTPETARDLEQLDIARVPFAGARPTRALLLGRDGIGVDERLRQRLEQVGATVTLALGEGYGEMMARPHHARAPVTVFSEVRAWLDEAPATPASNTDPLTIPHLAGPIELTVEGRLVRETPITVGQAFGNLMGILTEPVNGPVADVCAVMLNAGAIRRIGPNRMWVETARRWGALGVPTLRLDLEGIGDADGDAARFSELGELYVPALVDQVHDTLDSLQARGLGPRFVLAGLCSGAYWAFHSALTDDRVVAAYLLNPRALFWDPSLEVAREVRSALVRLSAWRKVLRGEIPIARVRPLLYRAPAMLARRVVAGARRRAALHRGGDKLEQALDRLSASETRIQLIFSANEPLLEELEREGRLAQRRRWPNLSVELVAGRVHTMRSADAQRSAGAALDRALDVELGQGFELALSEGVR